MISNPVNEFVNASETHDFIYEGGHTLYHFSPLDCGLSDYRNCNIVFFADSEEHAVTVLRRMFSHIIDCAQKFEVAEPNASTLLRHQLKGKQYQAYLDALDEGRVHVSLAPRNQVYKVGWAFNDMV